MEIAAKAVFRVPDAPLVADPPPKFQITAAQKKRAALMKKRAETPHRHAARAEHVLA